MQDDPRFRIGPGRCPPEILTALRAIDPAADLIHLEGKRWWLGVRAPNPAAQNEQDFTHAKRMATTRSTLADDPAERALTELQLGIEFQMRKVMAAGFRPIALYVCDGAPGAEIVEDFRLRDYNWRTQTMAQIGKKLRDDVSTEVRDRPRIARFAQAAREVASEAYRYTMRRARSVLVGANLE